MNWSTMYVYTRIAPHPRKRDCLRKHRVHVREPGPRRTANEEAQDRVLQRYTVKVSAWIPTASKPTISSNTPPSPQFHDTRRLLPISVRLDPQRQDFPKTRDLRCRAPVLPFPSPVVWRWYARATITVHDDRFPRQAEPSTPPPPTPKPANAPPGPPPICGPSPGPETGLLNPGGFPWNDVRYDD